MMKLVFIFLFGLFFSVVTQALDSKRTINIDVNKKGYEPNSITVKEGESITLKVKRTSNETCAKQIFIPSMNIKKGLPFNKVVTVDLGKLQKGEIKFGCAMDLMESGIIKVN